MIVVNTIVDYFCDTPSCTSQALNSPKLPSGWIMVTVTDSQGVEGRARQFCATCAAAAYGAVEMADLLVTDEVPVDPAADDPAPEPAPEPAPVEEPPVEEPVAPI